MAKSDTKDLLKMLEPFPPDVREAALSLREFIWNLYPDANELIYDNYNALAVGWGLSDKQTDIFCSFAVYAKHVNFGLNRGSEISDPENLFKGSGSLYRHITVTDEFPFKYVTERIHEAYINSLSKFKGEQTLKGVTIVKSISPKKKRPA